MLFIEKISTLTLKLTLIEKECILTLMKTHEFISDSHYPLRGSETKGTKSITLFVTAQDSSVGFSSSQEEIHMELKAQLHKHFFIRQCLLRWPYSSGPTRSFPQTKYNCLCGKYNHLEWTITTQRAAERQVYVRKAAWICLEKHFH